MTHVASDDAALIEGLEQRFDLEQIDAPMALPVLSNSSLLLYQLSHNGPRAAAQYGYLRGRMPLIPGDEQQLIVALAAPNSRHPALVHELRRGIRRIALEGVPAAAEAVELETKPVSVLPDTGDMQPPDFRAGREAARDLESPDARSDQEAARDLERAQAAFTAQSREEPTVSLMLWWLIAAAEGFEASRESRGTTHPGMQPVGGVYPLLIPKLEGAAATETMDAVEALLAHLHRG